MATTSKRAAKGPKRPRALPSILHLAEHNHGTVMSGEVLAFLFSGWLETQMKALQERLTTSESSCLAFADLQRFLTTLSNPNDTALPAAIAQAADRQVMSLFLKSMAEYDKASANNALPRTNTAIVPMREHFRLWSKVEGEDIMRVFLSDEANTNGEAEQLFAGLKLSPNRAFTWRLLFPSVGSWPLMLPAFEQQLWVGRFEFINDCIHDLGRPLPLMELGELWQHMPDSDILEQTIKLVLTPPELAYALAYGAFQLDINPEGLPPGSGPQRPRLKLNPLFTTSR